MNKLLRSQGGFTLVELMVVVAIIGVLSAIAVPNFKKYQAKSKTSEAKLQLSAAYTAQQSFYSDFDAYGGCLTFMGFNPVNEIAQRVYAVGFGSATAAHTAAHQTLLNDNGAQTCTTNDIFAGGKKTGTVAALTTFTATEGGGTSVTENAFIVGAVGVVDINFNTAATASAFTINQNKKLVQLRAGY